ncbi:hypothetical protein TVAG_262930 [Trichomonas vaginalis G3]|uniref:Uncharacterized protein n=1 Tax=Trichomonas vaginalis (strain ATCC PRA-98 / G3) TaxID=412133 RepID=A2FTD0_TRIV3|nr:solute carrier family 35 member F6 family [Trichomonas vaginalis G3]EAX91850.1 hypothetical protein TVAG_262930 [Trichomonas vaginalis G3]KAI5512606.1 solute carrier family 35 member F6 family [Trichomonas vaginalis G3]|eukprot:XP_001304780.1 hypothetical protein [Trichomonas vaginalis G3]
MNQVIANSESTPNFLNLFMAVAVFLSIIPDMIRRKRENQKFYQEIPMKALLLIPICAMIDLIQSLVLSVTIKKVSISTGSILYLFDTLVIILSKKFILKKKIFGFQLFAVLLMDAAMMLVLIADFKDPKNDTNFEHSEFLMLIGIHLICELLRSVKLLILEYIYENYDISCERFNSIAGLYEISATLFIIAPPLNFLNCKNPFHEDFCKDFRNLGLSNALIFSCFTYLFVSVFVNIFFMRCIYYSTCLSINVSDAVSAALIWVIETAYKGIKSEKGWTN